MIRRIFGDRRKGGADRRTNVDLPFSFWRNETPDTVIACLESLPSINQPLNPEYPGLPVHHAASTACAIAVMRRLLDLGADVNAANHNGSTPLHLYAQNGSNPAVADLLIARDANLYAQNQRGLIPLETAVAWHNGPIANAIAGHHSENMPLAWWDHLSFAPAILPPETYLWDYSRQEKDVIIGEYHRQASLSRVAAMPIEFFDLPPRTDREVNMMWERVLGAEKDSPYYWANRGYISFLVEHRDEDYQKCLENAISIAPNHPQNYITLGFVQSMMGDRSSALLLYDKAIAIDNRRADVYDLRATVYRSLEQFELAISDIHRAIELGPVNVASCYLKMAEYKLMLNDLQGAIIDVNTALTIDPGYERAHEMLAWLTILK